MKICDDVSRHTFSSPNEKCYKKVNSIELKLLLLFYSINIISTNHDLLMGTKNVFKYNKI